MNEIKGLKDLLQDGIKIVTDIVEETHMAYSEKTFNALKEPSENSEIVNEIKNTHDNITGKVYNTIRVINDSLGVLMDNVIENTNQKDSEDSKDSDK